MVTAELIKYVREQISQGQTSEIIKTTLINQGWSEVDVSQAFIQASADQSNQISQQYASASQPVTNNFKQQDIDRSTAMRSQVIGQINSGKESIFKYITYFFIGLILSLFGLLIGGIWIAVKEKQNKMRKVIVLSVGIIISIMFWFVITGGTRLNGNTANIELPKNPEAREIQLALSSLFPSLTSEVTYGEHSPPLSFGNTTISTFISVRILSKNTVTATEVTEVGKQVCSTLEKLQKNVSQVQVEIVETKYGIFSSSKGMGGTCEEWNSGKI